MAMWDHKRSSKEVLRHLMYSTGIYDLLKLKRRSLYATHHYKQNDRKNVFEEIYNSGIWLNDADQHSLSGKGSEELVAASIRAPLANTLEFLRVERMVDVGCGDWTWFQKMDVTYDYIGVDIVQSVVDGNQEKYGTSNIHFMHLDAVEEALPSSDVVLCREVIFHLSFADALRLIDNIKKSTKYLIATSCHSIWFNSNIPTGDFRELNLVMAPFRFPRPSHVIDDGLIAGGRILGVWDVRLL